MESANHSITNSATLKFFLQLKHTAENIITAVAEKLSWLSLLQNIYIYTSGKVSYYLYLSRKGH